MSLIHESLQESQPHKKLAILFGLAFFGAGSCSYKWYRVPSCRDPIQADRNSRGPHVSIKQGDVCVIEPPDEQPKSIQGCPYNIDDPLIVTYYERSTNVESHRLNK